MKVLVVGGGSIGLLLAGRLAAVNEVELLTHTHNQAEAIRRDGLWIVENEEIVRAAVPCSSFENEVASGRNLPRFDWVFLTVKQTHLNDSLIHYVKSISDQTRLLCFQNGIGHVERLAASGIPPGSIFVAITTEAARKTELNRVIHTGRGMTVIGGADSCNTTNSVQRIADLFQLAGLHAERTADIDSVVWNKLLINSVINPLTAMLNIKNGELMSSHFYVNIMRALFDEACLLMRKRGLKISDQLWEQLLDVCRKTGGNTSSMLQDIKAGRPTEIDSINGSLLRLAAENRIELPTHEAVYNVVKGMEQSRSRHS